MASVDRRLVTIETDPSLVTRLLEDLFAGPRRAVVAWSRITGQTAQVRLAYPGQHLASVVTGVKGSGTAARGSDLADGSEVKSCSRADQLGQCKTCEAPVLPYLATCPNCGGDSIQRKTDSHWILSLKSEAELMQYLEATRIVFILFDRPEDEPEVIRVRCWEVWPGESRHSYFRWFLENYFRENYEKKIAKGLTPAPCNLHPMKRDFLLMNPVLVMDAVIRDVDSTDSRVDLRFLAEPKTDRTDLDVELMPATMLTLTDRQALLETCDSESLSRCTEGDKTPDEIESLRQTTKGCSIIVAALKTVDEAARVNVPRREKRIKMTPSSYKRRST